MRTRAVPVSPKAGTGLAALRGDHVPIASLSIFCIRVTSSRAKELVRLVEVFKVLVRVFLSVPLVLHCQMFECWDQVRVNVFVWIIFL